MISLRSWVGLSSILAAALAAACGSSSGGGGGNGGDSGTSSGSDAMGNVCAPGQSIACVGAGGCQGGQACKSDGSGYEACVCGAGNDGGGSDGNALDSAQGSDSSQASDSANGTDAHDAESGAPSCTTYASSSVAAMRQGSDGCFSLANVVSIGVTPGTASPTLYFQDAAGGSYSAMNTTCSSTSSTHPCSHGAAVAAIANSHSVTVTGSYVHSAATHAEAFYLDSITDNGAGTAPSVATATLADVQRGSTSYGLAFQRVTLSLGLGSNLVMYDWSPSEFAVAGSACPYQLGFGMAPASAALTPTMACSNGASQPSGQAAPSGSEVLFGTDFYAGFTVTSDCRCAKAFSDQEPSALSQLTGTVVGVPVWTVPTGAAAGFMYLAPQSNSDAPITGTVPGM